MPLYKVSLRKAADDSWQRRVKWSNTFFLNTANAPAAAAAIAGAWVSQLRQACRTSVFAYEVYASSVLGGDEDYTVIGIPEANQRGTIVVPASTEQYQWNSCLAVTMRTATGRPSRKFWRPGLYESDVFQGTRITPALVQSIETQFNAFLNAMGGDLVDPDGQGFFQPVQTRFSQRKLGREASQDVPTSPGVG